MSFENAELLQIQEELDKLKEYQILKIETFLKQPFLIDSCLLSYEFFYLITSMDRRLCFLDEASSVVGLSENIDSILKAAKAWPKSIWHLICIVPYNKVCVTRDRIKSEFSISRTFADTPFRVSFPTPITAFYSQVAANGSLRDIETDGEYYYAREPVYNLNFPRNQNIQLTRNQHIEARRSSRHVPDN